MDCYYGTNFTEGTLSVDMGALYEAFLERVPERAVILDAGCGLGRDSFYFKKLGHFVMATDTSEEMCRFAGEYIGQSVMLCRFQDIHFKILFDGIWACASLIYVSSNELINILRRFICLLKDEGVLYTSFPYGILEGKRNGKYTLELDEALAEKLFTEAGYHIEKMWITKEYNTHAVNEKWLNVLAVKKNNQY